MVFMLESPLLGSKLKKLQLRPLKNPLMENIKNEMESMERVFFLFLILILSITDLQCNCDYIIELFSSAFFYVGYKGAWPPFFPAQDIQIFFIMQRQLSK